MTAAGLRLHEIAEETSTAWDRLMRAASTGNRASMKEEMDAIASLEFEHRILCNMNCDTCAALAAPDLSR